MPSFRSADLNLYRGLLRQARPSLPHIALIFLPDLFGTPLLLLTPIPLKIAVDNVIGSAYYSSACSRMWNRDECCNSGASSHQRGKASSPANRYGASCLRRRGIESGTGVTRPPLHKERVL